MMVMANPTLTDPAFWRLRPADRLATFAELRRAGAPVFFGERPGSAMGGRGPLLWRRSAGAAGGGFHALVRHADVTQASRSPEIFTSGRGVTTPRPPRWVRFAFGESMVNLDDPRHAALRGVISKAFTPRVIAKAGEDMRATIASIVDDLERGGGGKRPADFVEAVAGRLTFTVICDMMGIPPQLRGQVLGTVNAATEGSAVRARLRLPGRSLRSLARLHGVVGSVARQRRRRPADDLISALVDADVQGHRLTSRELGAFFSLLLVAGVETTRNAIAHGLWLLTQHPGQRELLQSDLDRWLPGFVEEVVRYSSPIVQFRRTVARDTVLNGHPLRAGEDVMLFYVSANRDEEVFTEPDAFDITRSPNPHVGFGGGGPHFCLGTALARQEMTLLFRELLTRLPRIRALGEPELVPSTFDNRVGRLAFTW
jgi:cytochrome P450